MELSKQDRQLLEMGRLFRIAEKHLKEFLEYVPIKEGNLKVVSPAIFDMMMSDGAQIEPMMVKLVELVNPYQIDPNHPDLFGECYKQLDQNGMLLIQKLITKEEGMIFQPFTNSNPDWWQAYNSHIKHRLPEGMEKATLWNLLNIHAGLFILHSMANLVFRWIVSYPDLPYRLQADKVLDKNSWVDLQEDMARGTVPVWVHIEHDFIQDRASPKNYQELMHYYSGLNSDVFDYVTVLPPNLFPS